MIIQQYKRLAEIPGIEKKYNLLPIFATQEYANFLEKIKKNSISWFYGIVNPNIRVIIPFAINKKYYLSKGQFLTATITLDDSIDNETEKEFLSLVIEIIKQKKLCDWIGQPPNWALFKVVPFGSIFCEFGSYIIDLGKNSESDLYNKFKRGAKYEIRKATKNDIVVKKGFEYLDDCMKIFEEASYRSTIEFPERIEINKLKKYLPENIEIYVSYHNDVPQTSNIIIFDGIWAYGLYSGTINKPLNGSNYLLFWQIIKDLNLRGIKYYNLVGARLNPIPGSKQERIQAFKRHLGGELIQGFLWKLPISHLKYALYNFLLRTFSFFKFKNYRSDIIDQELKRTNK